MNVFTEYLYELESPFNFIKPNNQQNESPNIYDNINSGQTTQNNYTLPDNVDSEKTNQPEAGSKNVDPKEGESNKVDPNKEGLIRRIKGAHLIYKRKSGSGTYEEMWQYNIKKSIRDELDIRHAILAGTDINPKTGLSQSNTQKYELWTNNNVQILQVHGLPN